MVNSRRSYASRKRLLTAIKVTALIAALGFVTVMLEQPRLTASPSHPNTSLQQPRQGDPSLNGSKPTLERSSYPTDSADAPLNWKAEAAPSAGAPAPAPSSENAASYFPGRFAPPEGEIAPQPPTF